MTAMILWAKKKQYGVWYYSMGKKAAYLTRHRLHCFQVALKWIITWHCNWLFWTPSRVKKKHLITLLPNRYIFLSCMGDMHLPFDCDSITTSIKRFSFYVASWVFQRREKQKKKKEGTQMSRWNFLNQDGKHQPIIFLEISFGACVALSCLTVRDIRVSFFTFPAWIQHNQITLPPFTIILLCSTPD